MTKGLFTHKCPTIDFLGWVNDFWSPKIFANEGLSAESVLTY